MCGICGIFDSFGRRRIDPIHIDRMNRQMRHRGPDAAQTFYERNIGLGFSRLSIIDLEGGMQPIANEDDTLLLVCNGEIFNYIELRSMLSARGHRFATGTDVEVLLHLYEEKGMDLLEDLNGQYAFAIFDRVREQLICARDHFGIVPFFYTQVDGLFIFASEIKAILEHPAVERRVDLVGLDQVFTFPGLIGDRTMFLNIRSLENGHYLTLNGTGKSEDKEYWDLVYPPAGESGNGNNRHDSDYIDELEELLTRSVKLRLRADVPVGFYLSGGLDSSLVGSLAARSAARSRRHSFSIDFEDKDRSESSFQRIMAGHINSIHHEQLFRYSDISDRLPRTLFHSEQPLKEAYNTASLALSEAARSSSIKVVLSGEGADEWFAGYPGYRFDKFRKMQGRQVEDPEERQLNLELWGDENFFFEAPLAAFRRVKAELFSEPVARELGEAEARNASVVNKERLQGRSILHIRSYLDYKLRLVGHLVADHGDRMALANSVEVRYPFLDKNLVEFTTGLPEHLILNDFQEKYILKELARGLVPMEIVKREKFAFHAPGSPYLLNNNCQLTRRHLSADRIKRQGYFNHKRVEELKHRYQEQGFRLNIPYENDLLMTILTFNVFLEEFKLPDFSGESRLNTRSR